MLRPAFIRKVEGRGAVRAAFAGPRVAAGTGKPAVGEGLLARFGQRDQREAAETERAGRAVDDEPLHPTLRPDGSTASWRYNPLPSP